MKQKTYFLVSQVPPLKLTKQTSQNVTDTNFKYKWQDGIWTHKFEYYTIML